MAATVEERFEAKVRRGGAHDLWTGARGRNGTGQIRIKGKLRTAPAWPGSWPTVRCRPGPASAAARRSRPVSASSTWLGRDRFPNAERLLITADVGGSNGYRLRAWKVEIARLATDIGPRITVCHYPPGTSKWTASSTDSSTSSP